MLIDRIRRFFLDPESTSFEVLALEAFRYQWERLEPVQRLARREGWTRESIRTWQEVPLVPTQAFAEQILSTDPPKEVFRSSGTLGSRRSEHHHPFPDLYRWAIEASFPGPSLPETTGRQGRVPILSLVPSRREAPDSSLAFMLEHVLECYGAPDSFVAWRGNHLDGRGARSFLSARQRDGRPTILLSTTLALDALISFLERQRLRFRLPAGSVLWETGGAKGRARDIDRVGLLERAEVLLGVPPDRHVEEYGMAELTSQAYTRTLSGGAPGVFHFPHWVRVRALDPETLKELAPGEVGVLAIFDLANLGSALHVLTEDLGSVELGGGFRLLGRAKGAPLRGCSLLAEDAS